MLKPLNDRVEEVIKIYEKQANHLATRTRQMLEKYGYIKTISKLVVSSDLQLGFKTLRDKNMLNDTFEHVVLEYADKFSKDVAEAAKWRLDNPYNLI